MVMLSTSLKEYILWITNLILEIGNELILQISNILILEVGNKLIFMFVVPLGQHTAMW